jgi:hypothetical protein
MGFETPEDILKEYNNGLPGAVYDPADMMKLLSELPTPFFGDAGNEIFGTGKGMLSLPFKAIQYFFPDFGKDEAQTTGDCVSHATRNAVDVTRAYEILYNKDKEVFLARGATEPIYGSRGHGGQGMQCSQAARFVNITGGFLVRENYSDIGLDLTKYNSKVGTGWGSKGIPQNVVNKCKEHQIGVVTTLNSIEQARDLLANGYGFSVCSNYGFSSVRDKNGIAEPDGSWSHAMAWIGCDDTHDIYNETLFLVQNSWGLWNSGPKLYEQPDGSFWIRQKVAEAMIGSGGAFAFSNFKGFQRKMVWKRIKEVFG